MQLGRFLLVEDNPTLRTLLTVYLERRGYDVVAADSSEELLGLLKEGTEPVIACLVDATLPGMNGAALLEQVAARFPAAKLILMSGYADAERPALRDARFLQKPFNPRELDALLG
mgnify:CR=1 FL=1